MFDDEVTVLEDETIEFIHDATPRPTSPPTTRPDIGEEKGVACCCRTPSLRRHHHYNVDDEDTDDTVK